MSRPRFFALALILVACAQPAAAQIEERRTQVVHFSDLDLAAPSGVAALDRRIQSAIRNVCGQPAPGDLRGRNDIRRCEALALADARAQRSVVLAQANGGTIRLSSRLG